jgi:hypothetical protein
MRRTQLFPFFFAKVLIQCSNTRTPFGLKRGTVRTKEFLVPHSVQKLGPKLRFGLEIKILVLKTVSSLKSIVHIVRIVHFH